MTEIQYAPAVGNKFYKDGSVRQFPGNTIICFADPDGQAYKDAEWVQNEILKEPYGHKFAMLPPSSFHMTVFELLCDEVREKSHWSFKLSLDASLIETDKFFIDAFKDVSTPDNFQMVCTGMAVGRTGLMLALEPKDDAVNKHIRGYRNMLAATMGILQPNHETYGFHLSLAYRIIQTTAEEEAQLEALAERVNVRLNETFGLFDTGKPMLTFFDDMFAFVPESERLNLMSRK